MGQPIDLRSDTVTRPSPAMREAMAQAEVGDDVLGDDPTVLRLQAKAAELFEFERALFFPSGTQSNLAALMAHCQRGDEVLLGQDAHTYCHEGGGVSVLGSIQPQPLEHESDGTFSLERIRRAVKEKDVHFPRTRLLALENTLGGKVMPQAWVESACALADGLGLSTHLDGARLFNAAVKQQLAPKVLAAPFDSVSICLSKGLGAPVGSLLLGTRDLIREALRWRKMLGGGMRQVGILAAAGLYALEHNVERLSVDHDNARRLADGLKDLPGLKVEPPQTNIVWVHLTGPIAEGFCDRLAAKGILALGTTSIRFVTHLDVSAADVDLVVGVVKQLAG